MKKIVSIFTLCVFMTLSAFSANGPTDPAGKGSGILGIGFGPGIPFYGGGGFGPAIIAHYDHSIWQVGPGAISLGGQFGTSFFWKTYNHKGVDYKEAWTNLGFVFRSAYHYGWKVPGLDTYAGFGAGTWISLYTDDGKDHGHDGLESSKVGFQPTAFFGASYYFNDLIGLNAEVGYNFAYASIGINFRLAK